MKERERDQKEAPRKWLEREREREIECGGVSKGCTKWTMMVMARTE